MSREEFDAVLADKDAEIKRLRRRMEAITCPCPNMADLEDIASERDALAEKVAELLEAARDVCVNAQPIDGEANESVNDDLMNRLRVALQEASSDE